MACPLHGVGLLGATTLEDAMETSRFLAKVAGLFLLISGVWLVGRAGALPEIAEDLTRSPALVIVNGRVALIVGLLLVVSHNRWRGDWTALITALGWLVLLAGLTSLFLPGALEGMSRVVTAEGFMRLYGVVVLGLGSFLTYKGVTREPADIPGRPD
jgi:uncharacterized membrane protein